MKIFVTGATGVLGRPVVRMLMDDGAEIVALSRSAANRESIVKMGATPVDADLFDVESLSRHITGCGAVLHLATSIPPVSKLRSADALIMNDRIRDAGTKALVEAALASQSVKTFLYPGICFMYADGGARWLAADDAEIRAPSPLRSTLAAERHVAAFDESKTVRRGITLRFGAFYGATSRDSRDMLNMARKGVVLPMAPDDAYRSFIWVDDAATAIHAALENADSGIYDVVEDVPYTQREAIEALARAVRRKRLWRLPRWMLRLALTPELRELVGRSQRVSAKRFKDITGWQPDVRDQTDGWVRVAREVAGA
ncbi:MAG: NAD(P)-dependent oxidoreductase [Hyphomicrobiaceae bacterium]|nr:NAD(P)-dependent oxidoreductase [Hyphomicrobiaceae bacterium]